MRGRLRQEGAPHVDSRELILHFCCLVPLAWLLGITLGFGLVGIWTAALVYVVLLTAVMIWKFKSGDWKTIKL